MTTGISHAPPELAAPMAALAEHVFPLLLLMGLGTRFSALAIAWPEASLQIITVSPHKGGALPPEIQLHLATDWLLWRSADA